MLQTALGRAESLLSDLNDLCSRLCLHAKHLTFMKIGTNKTAYTTEDKIIQFYMFSLW